jgi:predicted Fe-Mo cluster-binding NifX family protein
VRVAVSSVGKTLDSQVDRRFGRCPYFLVVDSETLEFKVVTNAAAGAMGGAGIQAANSVVGEGIKAVITGNVGPNAFQTLSAAGKVIITGASGTVKEVIEQFNRGELHETKTSTVDGHFGMGQGRERGQGRRRG